ncbi:hypothetical protein ACFSQE_03455 [Vogesella fluminis]
MQLALLLLGWLVLVLGSGFRHWRPAAPTPSRRCSGRRSSSRRC